MILISLDLLVLRGNRSALPAMVHARSTQGQAAATSAMQWLSRDDLHPQTTLGDAQVSRCQPGQQGPYLLLGMVMLFRALY